MKLRLLSDKRKFNQSFDNIMRPKLSRKLLYFYSECNNILRRELLKKLASPSIPLALLKS